MSNAMTKLVTSTRFRQLLDCYGSASSAWPEDERQAALTLLKTSPELQTLRNEAQSLDNLLAQYQAQEEKTVEAHNVQSLQQRIMCGLPAQTLSESDDIIPIQDSSKDHTNVGPNQHPHRSHLWMGSLAAGLFIVSLSFGVIHQLFGPGHSPVPPVDNQHIATQQNNNPASNDFAAWAWEDITGEPLSDDTDNGPATMLALVEMELPVE